MQLFTPLTAFRAAANPNLTLDHAGQVILAAAHALANKDETITRLIRKEPYAAVETVEMVQEAAADHSRAAIGDAPLPALPGGETVESEPPLGVG